MMAGADGAPTVADTRNQELVGLVAIALGGVLLFAAFDGWSEWLTDGPTTVIVAFVLAAANLTAAGFFVLLSGLDGRGAAHLRRLLRIG